MTLTKDQVKIRALGEKNNEKVREDWKDRYKVKRPFYKKLWFWIVVGITIAALWLGVTLVRHTCCS